jgi:hypothetical protein
MVDEVEQQTEVVAAAAAACPCDQQQLSVVHVN